VGIEQVNKSISQMDEVVEQNSALVEQLAAASESMKDQAQELKRQVTFFKVGNNSETDLSSSAKRKTRSNGSTTKTLAQNIEETGDWRDF
jgi:methyl-accepting chemotaxis protein